MNWLQILSKIVEAEPSVLTASQTIVALIASLAHATSNVPPPQQPAAIDAAVVHAKAVTASLTNTPTTTSTSTPNNLTPIPERRH
jgi:hypothetical protein